MIGECAESFAIGCNARMEAQKASYLGTLKKLNACRDSGAPVKKQKKCLPELHAKATAFFNTVERSIIDCELLRNERNEAWARDLANTAVNVLESIPELYK